MDVAPPPFAAAASATAAVAAALNSASAAAASKSNTNATATTASTNNSTTAGSTVSSTSLAATITANNESDRNANLIILATHVINRLMTHLTASADDDCDHNDDDVDNDTGSDGTDNDTKTKNGSGADNDLNVDAEMKDADNITTNTSKVDGNIGPPSKKKKHDEQQQDTTTTASASTNTSTNNHNDSHNKQLALVLSIYATTLTKILLADKTKLEQTMNATSSSSGKNNSAASTAAGGTATSRGASSFTKNNKNNDEGGRNPKSILGRAILSSTLAALKSMHALSKSTPPSDSNKIYAKTLWRDALVLERLLVLGANYRSFSSKGSSKGSSGGSHSSKVATIQSAMLSGGVGGMGGEGHGLSMSGGIGEAGMSATVNSVHNMNMDLRRVNVWNEICAAMELEEECKSLEISGGAKGSFSTSPSALLLDNVLIEALTESNRKIFLDSRDGDCMLKLILFEDPSNKGGNGGCKKKDEKSTTPPVKRRRVESSTSSAATRTRSRTLSDKNERDNVCNEFAMLSDKVSEEIFSFEFNKAVLAGNSGNKLTLKKWSSMAFAWVCNGQEIGLETVRNILLTCDKSTSGANTTGWEDNMQISTVITGSPPSGRKKGKTTLAERKRASATNARTKGSLINIPGNVVLLTFASRVIDIVNEGGKMAGNSLPRNGTDKYANLFKSTSLQTAVSGLSPSKSPGSSTKTRRTSGRKTAESASASSAAPDVKADVVISSGSKSKPSNVSNKSNQRKRRDIRNLSIVVMELLLVVHQQSLKDNVAMPSVQTNGNENSFEQMHFSPKFPLQPNEKLRQILLNEDGDTVGGGMAPLSLDHRKELLLACRYFPQIHKTIDTLIKCVSSVVSSIGGIDDCTTRLTAIATALAIKYSMVVHKLTGPELKQQKKVRCAEGVNANTIVVVDAKLCSFGVEQLSTSVGNITTSSNQPFSEDADPPVYELTPDLVQEFSLHKPISFRSQIGDTSEYLGLFKGRADLASVSTVSNEQRNKQCLYGEILALFLRAMITNKNAEGKSEEETSTKNVSMLTETLLRIITCCYSMEVNNISTSTGTRFVLCLVFSIFFYHFFYSYFDF